MGPPPNAYQPLPDNQIFPAWERYLKLGAVGALLMVSVVGFRYWRSQQAKPAIPIVTFPKATQWAGGDGLTLGPAVSHSGKVAAYASDRDQRK